ncbi:hypothetical protein CBR_g16136 [Chara braunii]|uniref:RING-type domain-containing protein n=1 Tax=Chara braunii TaxID=69332 RepID=A0A388KTM5_CHABU|nr:hypothetical protein CBR_g16136 [Chara braunii]|eukprot:GBG73420.1 hypothetical protein CBR_g16136 [Chara braunii]
MNRICHDYLDKFVIVHLDDILIFSKTVEEHVARLDKVRSLLRQHKFKINGEKCEFGPTRVLYLGHKISAEGLKPDDEKVTGIRDWPRPQSVTEMRSFLGMTGYYHNFVKNHSIVASPLTDLTRLDTPWEWTERCEAAFRHLKHALTHYEVLKLPDPDNPFIVTTDTSQYGIGVVLAQQEGKKLRPVEYMSKKMSSQKLAKSTYEKELYAVYKALTHWRHYLLGRFFILMTDHQTLRWMRTQPVLSDALKRWIKVIEQYDFEPQYIKGEYNKVVDALSRRPDFSARDNSCRGAAVRRHPGGWRDDVVVGYLRVGKMEIPLLVVTNNLSENIFESPVRDLGLTISLRMVRRGEVELSVVHLVEPSPESAGKARVTLGLEAMSVQAVKDVAEVSEEGIVEVDENVLLQDVPEDVVHRPLEGSGCVGTSWMECPMSRIGGMQAYENDDGKKSWYSRMKSRTAGSRSSVAGRFVRYGVSVLIGLRCWPRQMHQRRHHDNEHHQPYEWQAIGGLLPSLYGASGIFDPGTYSYLNESDAELATTVVDSAALDPRVQMAALHHRRWVDTRQSHVSFPHLRLQMETMQQRHQWVEENRSPASTTWVGRHAEDHWDGGRRRYRHRYPEHRYPLHMQEDYGLEFGPMEADSLGNWFSTSDEEFRDGVQPMEEWLSLSYWISSEEAEQEFLGRGVPYNSGTGSRGRSPVQGTDGVRWVLNRHMELSRRAARFHQRRGLRADVFEALPKEVFKSKVTEGQEGKADAAAGHDGKVGVEGSKGTAEPVLEQEECPVCLEVFETGQSLLRLPCRHLFHIECIRPWFQNDSRCPYCRSEVPGGRSDGEEEDEELEGEGEMMLEEDDMEFVANGVDEDSSSEESDTDLDGAYMLGIETLIADMELGAGRESSLRRPRRPWR